MADDDQDSSRPNLEPPKLFGRKRRMGDEPELDLPPEPEPDVVPEPDPEPEAELDLPPEAEPGADETTVVEPFSDPTWMFEDPEPAAEPATDPEPATAVLPAEAGTPLFADEVDGVPPPTEAKPQGQRVAREPRPVKEPKEPKAAKKPPQPRAAKPRLAAPKVPVVSGWIAAGITGIVIGLLLVGMTAGSLQGCEAVRGTSTCGGSGVILLIVIMALLIAFGGFLLRIFQVPDPVSTSFLALGMVAVITLLFLLDVLENWWTIIIIPVISAAMYLVGYWVTTAFVEPAKEPAEK